MDLGVGGGSWNGVFLPPGAMNPGLKWTALSRPAEDAPAGFVLRPRL